MSRTKISWTTDVWNPVIGCSKVSEGCARCYAERMAKRLCNIEQCKFDDIMAYAPAGSTFGRKYSKGTYQKLLTSGKEQ
jgi:protein gp37